MKTSIWKLSWHKCQLKPWEMMISLVLMSAMRKRDCRLTLRENTSNQEAGQGAPVKEEMINLSSVLRKPETRF